MASTTPKTTRNPSLSAPLPQKFRHLNVETKLVRSRSFDIDKAPVVTGPKTLYEIGKKIEGSERERFLVIYVNTQNRVVGVQESTIGDSDSAIVDKQSIIRTALLASANGMAFIHNHPSGIPTPSAADIQITEEMKKVAKSMDIRLLDHLVVGHNDFISMREKGLGPWTKGSNPLPRIRGLRYEQGDPRKEDLILRNPGSTKNSKGNPMTKKTKRNPGFADAFGDARDQEELTAVTTDGGDPGNDPTNRSRTVAEGARRNPALTNRDHKIAEVIGKRITTATRGTLGGRNSAVLKSGFQLRIRGSRFYLINLKTNGKYDIELIRSTKAGRTLLWKGENISASKLNATLVQMAVAKNRRNPHTIDDEELTAVTTDGGDPGNDSTTRSRTKAPEGARNPGRAGLDRIIQAWASGRKAKSTTFSTNGNDLHSYNLLIGKTVRGKKVVLDYSGPVHSVSRTTSAHITLAKTVADKVQKPEARNPDTKIPDLSTSRHEIIINPVGKANSGYWCVRTGTVGGTARVLKGYRKTRVPGVIEAIEKLQARNPNERIPILIKTHNKHPRAAFVNMSLNQRSATIGKVLRDVMSGELNPITPLTGKQRIARKRSSQRNPNFDAFIEPFIDKSGAKRIAISGRALEVLTSWKEKAPSGGGIEQTISGAEQGTELRLVKAALAELREIFDPNADIDKLVASDPEIGAVMRGLDNAIERAEKNANDLPKRENPQSSSKIAKFSVGEDVSITAAGAKRHRIVELLGGNKIKSAKIVAEAGDTSSGVLYDVQFFTDIGFSKNSKTTRFTTVRVAQQELKTDNTIKNPQSATQKDRRLKRLKNKQVKHEKDQKNPRTGNPVMKDRRNPKNPSPLQEQFDAAKDKGFGMFVVDSSGKRWVGEPIEILSKTRFSMDVLERDGKPVLAQQWTFDTSKPAQAVEWGVAANVPVRALWDRSPSDRSKTKPALTMAQHRTNQKNKKRGVRRNPAASKNPNKLTCPSCKKTITGDPPLGEYRCSGCRTKIRVVTVR